LALKKSKQIRGGNSQSKQDTERSGQTNGGPPQSPKSGGGAEKKNTKKKKKNSRGKNVTRGKRTSEKDARQTKSQRGIAKGKTG